MRTHERWIKALQERAGKAAVGPDEDLCLTCYFFRRLKGYLGYDWGVCSNPQGDHDGLLTFEHFGCEVYVLARRCDARGEHDLRCPHVAEPGSRFCHHHKPYKGV